MTKITTDLTTHQKGMSINGVQRLFADEAARNEINAHDTRLDTLESGKQDVISDLATIRSGAAKGATAIQEHQDISGKADASDLSSHTSNKSNPHAVTKAQVGLGNVDNTSDANKPISTATQSALDLKLAKTEAASTYQPKGNYLTSHQDISGKSDKTHTHTVKINGTTKTIAATGGEAVDLGTYLTEHQDISGKQDTLTFDDIPTASSSNPVKSSGIKSSIDTVQSNVDNEKARAEGVESGLDTRLDTVESDQITMKTQISMLLALHKSAGLQWNLADTVKTPVYIGDTNMVNKILTWIDESPRPCEVKKDGTDFAYLLNTAGVASETNWVYREDGTTPSHYNTEDKADYLQMVEFENINMYFETDEAAGTATLLFNFDEECPTGFHRWFKEPTKLFARYDGSKNATDTSTYDIMKGGNWTGNNSASLMYTMNKATNENLMELTAWEYAVWMWLLAFKYKSFDSQTVLGSGISSGYQTSAEAYINGITDSLTTPHGKVTTTGGEAVRFMYVENPYGLRWIWCAGARQDLTVGRFTYDEDKANTAALMAIEDADETYTLPSSEYVKNVNILGTGTEVGASASSGFYDLMWSNTGGNNYIYYVGAASTDGVSAGAFARSLYITVSFSGWDLRGRGALKKSVVTSA